MICLWFTHEGVKNFDELRYDYHRMEVQCPLCESMICRFKMVQHRASIKCRSISGIEKITEPSPVRIEEMMELMKLKVMISTRPNCHYLTD